MDITWIVLQLLAGILLLAWSSDRFLHASVSLAKHWNWSPFVVGVVLVGFGTSFPEWVIALTASVKGSGLVAVGNVFGSNIANFLLVFGLSAFCFPIAVNRVVWQRDFPWLLGVTALLSFLAFTGALRVWEGLVLLLMLVVVMSSMLHRSKKTAVDLDECVQDPPMNFGRSVCWWLLGLGMIVLASEWLIHSAVVIAHWMGLSELIIGLTVVTLGTSLPELAATLVSAWRGQSDVALGHLVGSNIFNSTAVLAMPALFSAGQLPLSVTERDYPWLLLVTVGMWFLLIWQSDKPRFNRWLAGGLVLVYIAYMGSLFL